MDHPSTPTLRLACLADVEALEELITASVRELLHVWYSPEQLRAARGTVFGVDRLLIRDGTYFAVEQDGRIVACGGWSRRPAVFGGDRDRPDAEIELDPSRDAARVRAFFVHPSAVRHGLGRMLLRACEAAITDAGFRDVVLVATLAGESLYAAHGYQVEERYEAPLPGGLKLPVVRMRKQLG